MNNKGFTLIELIVSVVLIAIIIIPTFAIILNFKNRQQIASDKQELSKFKNLITSDIEDDILQYGLISIDKDETLSNDTKFVAILTFSKNITKNLIINSNSKKNEKQDSEIKTITYGDETYKLTVPYADIVSDEDMRSYYGKGGYIEPVLNGTNMQYYFQIKIPIIYINDTNNIENSDYGINIIAERAL